MCGNGKRNSQIMKKPLGLYQMKYACGKTSIIAFDQQNKIVWNIVYQDKLTYKISVKGQCNKSTYMF